MLRAAIIGSLVGFSSAKTVATLQSLAPSGASSLCDACVACYNSGFSPSAENNCYAGACGDVAGMCWAPSQDSVIAGMVQCRDKCFKQNFKPHMADKPSAVDFSGCRGSRCPHDDSNTGKAGKTDQKKGGKKDDEEVTDRP